MKRRVVSFMLSMIVFTLSLTVFPWNTVHASESENTVEDTLIENDKLFIGVGDVYEFDLQYEVDYYYITTVSSDIVSVVTEGSISRIVGVSPGRTYVLINYYLLDGTFSSCSCRVDVFDDATVSADDYYFYLSVREVVLSAELSSMVQPWSSKNVSKSVWTISPAEEHYYTIKLATDNQYLGVNTNSQLQLYSSSLNTPIYWRFFVDSNGKTILVPRGMEQTNMALGYNGSKALMVDYYTNVSSQRWKICSKKFYLDVYYDTSAKTKLNGVSHNKLRSNFLDASGFVTTVYNSMGFAVEAKGTPVYRSDLLADSCPLGDNASCNSTCQIDHKDINMMSNELKDVISREHNHVVVLWGDRKNSVYTKDGVPYNEDLLAHQLSCDDMFQGEVDYPIIDVFTVTKMQSGEITDSDTIEAIMSIILAHEMAHVFKMEEVSLLKDGFGNDVHTKGTVGDCIMNYLTVSEMQQFYDEMCAEKAPYFCDDCLAFLEENIPQTIYLGNGQ